MNSTATLLFRIDRSLSKDMPRDGLSAFQELCDNAGRETVRKVCLAKNRPPDHAILEQINATHAPESWKAGARRTLETLALKSA